MCGFDSGCLTENGLPDYIIIKEHFEPDKVLLVDDVKRMKRNVDLTKAPWRMVTLGPALVDPVPIPCGHCWQCRLDAAKNWTIRGVLEAQYHSHCYFVTLTYDDEHLKFDDSGQAILDFEDHQKFLKRFRKAVASYCKLPQRKVKVRFLGCGEYGETTGRPHLHYILYMDVPLPLKQSGINHFHCDLLDDTWPFGVHDISNCEPGCIAYVAGYVVKKAKADNSMFSVAPFRTCSRKPGLGRDYFEKHPDMLDTLKVYGNFGKASSKPIPRYFRVLLGDEYKALKDRLKASADLGHRRDQGVYGASSYEEIGCKKDGFLIRDIYSKEDKL